MRDLLRKRNDTGSDSKPDRITKTLPFVLSGSDRDVLNDCKSNNQRETKHPEKAL